MMVANEAVPEAALDAARTSQAPPVGLVRDAFFVPPLGPPPGPEALGALAVRAVRRQARAMLAGRPPPIGTAGVAALRALAADLPGWSEAPDRSWAARFAYQNIERRGTGGGGFRALYAGFLERAAEVSPVLAASGLAAEMRAIAGAWTEAAAAFRAESEREGPEGLADLSARLGALAEREETFFRRALEATDAPA